MDRSVAIAALSCAVEAGTLPEKDRGFAESLVTQSKARGLSDKQWYWVGRLAAAITNATVRREVGEFGGVYRMFQKAKEHLKYPKVVLQLPSGGSLKLYLSGARSRVPDTVNAVSNDTDAWYGRVYADGRWEGGNTTQGVEEVEAMLKEFATNPEEVAAAHGKLTGNCCFCSRKLTDERSTDVGYGPVCASRYGLKWGKK